MSSARVSTRTQCPGCGVWFTTNCLAVHQRSCCPELAPPRVVRRKSPVPPGHCLCKVPGCGRIVARIDPFRLCFRHQERDARLVELDALAGGAV